jgi:type IV pilus assembly protein PilB
MSFAAALRTLLRQDPDVIMVGEIRDAETARIAVQAALTGHLVLSTLHTNDAPTSITRLVNIGVEPYLLSASVNAILAQRLVRKICPNCKERYRPSDNLCKFVAKAGIEPESLCRGKGCDQCRKSGYVGRLGIFEFLVVNENYKAIINSDCSINTLKAAFEKDGSGTLYQDGMRKVRDGITTIDEVLRVTEAYQAK